MIKLTMLTILVDGNGDDDDDNDDEREREREKKKKKKKNVCLFVGCLTSQQHASVSQGRICTDNFTCCHTEIEAADPTFHLTQSHSILTPGRPVPVLTL